LVREWTKTIKSLRPAGGCWWGYSLIDCQENVVAGGFNRAEEFSILLAFETRPLGRVLRGRENCGEIRR
jgi:hypothetical protein